jgi:hypothetical protein
LPTGSHTYAVSFSNCLVNYLAGTELNGVASAAYRAAEWSNLTATVSAESMRGQGLFPVSGSRLVNNSTSNVATFGGGSYSLVPNPGNRWEQRFDNLKVAVNGTEYRLSGNLETTIAPRGTPGHTGEIRIISDGTLAARIYGDVRNALTIEVLVPLIPL